MNGQVSLVDVAPTVLDALGVLSPVTFEGRSLLAAARGGEAAEAEAWAETEHTIDGSRKIAVRRGASGAKSIFTVKESSLQIELFDLGRDPRETATLEAGGSRSALERRLRPIWRRPVPRRAGKTAPPVELNPEDLERLRSLGYVR